MKPSYLTPLKACCSAYSLTSFTQAESSSALVRIAELCEYKVRALLGEDVKNPIENLDFYDSEMEESAEEYAQFISEILAEAKQKCADPITLVEQRLDFSKYVPEGFGTGDSLTFGGKFCNRFQSVFCPIEK